MSKIEKKNWKIDTLNWHFLKFMSIITKMITTEVFPSSYLNHSTELQGTRSRKPKKKKKKKRGKF